MFYTGRHGIFQAPSVSHRQKNDHSTSNQQHHHHHLPRLIRKNSIIKPRETTILDQSDNTSSLPGLSNTQGNDEIIPQKNRKSFMNILSFNINDRKKEKEQEIEEFRRNTKKIISTIIIDNPSVHWKREEYGGVKVWVNEKTGEVTARARPDNGPQSTRRLKRDDSRDGRVSRRLQARNRMESLDGPKPRNIPPLQKDQESSRTVYQNEDMKELMALLNGETMPPSNNSSVKKPRVINPLNL